MCIDSYKLYQAYGYDSIISPFLFKIYYDDFADQNTITATRKNLSDLLKTIQQESESVSNWFKQNEKIVIAAKFRVAVFNKKDRVAKYKLAIDSIDIETIRYVKLLKTTIDECGRFDKYM